MSRILLTLHMCIWNTNAVSHWQLPIFSIQHTVSKTWGFSSGPSAQSHNGPRFVLRWSSFPYFSKRKVIFSQFCCRCRWKDADCTCVLCVVFLVVGPKLHVFFDDFLWYSQTQSALLAMNCWCVFVSLHHLLTRHSRCSHALNQMTMANYPTPPEIRPY